MAGLALDASPSSAAPVDDDLASRFTLAVLPDTQFYSRYSSGQFEQRYGTDPFATQTEWLAEQADELKIPFVAHLGDVVDQAGVEQEWIDADRAMQTLDDAGLPYSILAGNHDVLDSTDSLDDTGYDLANEPFLKWFGTDRAAQQSTYQGSDPTGMSQYHIFEAEGQQYMVLALPWRASDATFDWADAAMAAHPDVPVILTTHQLIDIAPDGITPKETDYGLEVWDKLIRGNDQIFLTLNGHFHGASQLTKTNDAGHAVTQLVVDYQMAYEGGNGYLGLFEFDLSNNTITVQTGSPWVVSKPRETLTSYDQAFLEAPNQAFTIDIDFAERFAAFAPGFTAGPATTPSLVQRARDILLDGFTAPDPVSTELPGSTEDFPRVDGTLAHWRSNGHEGVLPEGGTIPDVAGGADLIRATIADSGSPTAQPGDVSVVDDSDPYSSDGSATCFTDSDKISQRFSYLTSEDGAAVNDDPLLDGYTIETFLKIDAGWNQDENAWMKAIVRSGNRSKVGAPETPYDYTSSPVALGLSNLREFQWSELPFETAKGDRTNWSGEIMVDKWTHVAVVNDPDTATTTLYVDGAPVLRTASDTVGHGLDAGMPWLFGSDWVDDHAVNGWDGCIGETRVVDHPLDADQWLTARGDLSTLVVDVPSEAIPAGDVPSSIAGTGTEGATVTLAGGITGSATVGSDGTWSVELADALAAGEYAFTAQQAFGTRAAEPVAARVSVLADSAPVDPGSGSSDGGGSGSDDAVPGSGTGTDGASNGSLAFTGSDLPWITAVGGALLLILGGAAVAITRRRIARQSGSAS